MRTMIVVLMLPLAACSAEAHYSDPRGMSKLNSLYEARDTCLIRHAASAVSDDASASSAAREISASCQAEVDKLISISNPHNDPEITAAIQKDTEFRATGFVLKARGQVVTD
jgi:hypothetical protein